MTENTAEEPTTGRNPRRNTIRGSSSRRRRHRSRSRRNVSQVRRRDLKKFFTSMRQFSAMQIVIGLCAIFIQVGLIVNHSVLSEGEQGIWTGAFFVVSGTVCLVLGGNKVNFTNMMTIICCCLVTLFVAMTLSSLGWIGVETSLWCEYWYITCNKTYYPQITTTPVTTQHVTHSTTRGTTAFWPEWTPAPNRTGSYLSEVLEFFTRDRVSEIARDRLGNDDVCPIVTQPGFCGWLLEAPRILYSFLMLLGVTQATVSFMMAAIACTSKSIDPRRRIRPSIALIFGDSNEVPQRGIRAWELPPTQKEVEAGLAEPGQQPQGESSASEDEEEPPPPYEAISA